MSMYGITYEGVRVGNVFKAAGNPPEKRWVASSVYTPSMTVGNSREFPTRKAAEAWLVEEHKAKGPKG